MLVVEGLNGRVADYEVSPGISLSTNNDLVIVFEDVLVCMVSSNVRMRWQERLHESSAADVVGGWE